jgi:hypothetical protein
MSSDDEKTAAPELADAVNLELGQENVSSPT